MFVHPPRDQGIKNQLLQVTPKVIITGEGTGGHNFDALIGLFNSKAEHPISEQ